MEIQEALEKLIDGFDCIDQAEYERDYDKNYQAALHLLSLVAEKSFIAGENHLNKCYSGGAYYPDLTEYLKQFTDNLRKP